MSALTSLFNFLYVYLRFLVCLLFGGLFHKGYFLVEEQQEIAGQILYQFTDGQFLTAFRFPGVPFFALILGIFVVGGIIGLIRRIMR